MLKKLKEIFDNWFIEAVERNNIVQQAYLEVEIQDAKDDVWSDTASKDDLENLEYEVDEMGSNYNDLDNSFVDLDKKVNDINDVLDGINKSIGELRKCFIEINKQVDALLTVLNLKDKIKELQKELDKQEAAVKPEEELGK